MHFKVLPEITEKQKEIMDMMWQFRFMNRHQIQKMFNYKDPRRLNEWLRDLVNKGYLGRIYSHKLLENTKPSVYYLMNNGIILHRYRQFDYDEAEAKDMKKYYEDKKASEVFIQHNIAVCHIYQQFMDLNDKTWEYEGWAKNEMWASQLKSKPMDDEYSERSYLPDLQITKSKKPEYDTWYQINVELYDPQIPWYAIEGKVRKYFEMYTSENITAFQKDPVMPMTIMLIFSNNMKLHHTRRFIEEQLYEYDDTEDLTFKLTTYEKVIEHGVGDEKIWKTVGQNEEDEE